MLYRTPVLAFLTQQQHQRSASQYLTRHMISAMPSSPHPAQPPPVFQSIKEAQEYIISAEGVAKTTPCGELKCQHDSMISSLNSAHIMSYVHFIPNQPKQKKKKKNNKKQPSSSSSPNTPSNNYLVVLSDSIFFPAGGGQPSDSGEIIIEEQAQAQAQPSNNDKSDRKLTHLQVIDAQNIQGTCVLTCNTKDSNDKVQSILSSYTKTISTPDANDNNDDNDDDDHGHDEQFRVIQKLNWEKRFEYMTSHSAQHLISAVALRDYDLNTQSFSLRADSLVSYIDFSWDGGGLSLSSTSGGDIDFKSTFAQIEEKVNDLIQNNLSMIPTWIDPESKNSQKEEGGLRSRLLPKDMKGKVRIVSIEGIDMNTCCGTHVKSLGQLQMIKFFRVEKVKANVIRVYFASGKRLMKILKSYNDQSMALVNMLSCTEQETVERVQNLLDEKRERERNMKDLKEKLCQSQANEVIEELKENGNVAVIDLGYGIDMDFMTMLSSEVAKKCGEDEAILLFVGRPGNSTPVEEGSFLLTGPSSIVDIVGKEVAVVLGGRGGGRHGKFQGKGTKVKSSLDEARNLLRAKIDN